MKGTVVTISFCLILLLPELVFSANDPIPSGGTIQGKITRVYSDRVDVDTGSNAITSIYVDGNTQINGSTRNTIGRVLGGVIGTTHDLRAGDQITATVTRNQEGLIAQSITTQGATANSGSATTTAPPTAANSGRVCVRDERANQQGQIVCGEPVH
ncbi:MAG TPA: hypothetical protein VGJ57_01930 [Nitrospirales bacterium]|jgi:hypothetical protein